MGTCVGADCHVLLASPTSELTTACAWNRRASVGTWLQRRDSTPEAEFEVVATVEQLAEPSTTDEPGLTTEHGAPDRCKAIQAISKADEMILAVKAAVAGRTESMLTVAFKAKRALRRSMERSKQYKKKMAVQRWTPVLTAIVEATGQAIAELPGAGAGHSLFAPGQPEEFMRQQQEQLQQRRVVMDPRRKRMVHTMAAVPPRIGGMTPRPPQYERPSPPMLQPQAGPMSAAALAPGLPLRGTNLLAQAPVKEAMACSQPLGSLLMEMGLVGAGGAVANTAAGNCDNFAELMEMVYPAHMQAAAGPVRPQSLFLPGALRSNAALRSIACTPTPATAY